MLTFLSQRDISICAFCQHRISLLRAPAPPHSRLYSVTARCGNNYDLGRGLSARNLPFGLPATVPSAPERSFSSFRHLNAVPSSAGNAETSTPAPTAAGRPKLIFKRPKARQDNELDPHEEAARNSVLIRKPITRTGDNTPPPGLPARRQGLPENDPRLSRQAENRARIERHLRTEADKRYGDTSLLKRKVPGLPGISLSRTDLGSDSSIRYELASGSAADRASPVGYNFYRRVGHRPDPPLRPVPATPVPPPPARQQPNIGQNSDSNDFVSSSLSSLVGSAAFWKPGATKASTEPSPSRTAGDTQAGQTLVNSTSQTANNTISPSSGFDALEAAGLRDAEIKASVRSDSRGTSLSREWNQLARKPARRTSLDEDAWNAIQPDIVKSQPQPSDPWGLRKPSSDSWAMRKDDAATDRLASRDFDNSISKSPQRSDSRGLEESSSDSWTTRKDDTVTDRSASQDFNNSIPKTPQHQDGFDRDKERRWDMFERDPKPNKRRGGKRSQRGSRFEDDDDGGDAYERYQERARQKELRKAEREAKRTEPIPIILPELISITAFANALKIRPEEFLVQLGELGFEGVTLDSLMAGETAALVAQEYGYEPTIDAGDSEDLKPRPPPADPSLLPPRPPVVTIMGHVDHGKTTILDYLRKSSVAAQEHGGITQHIGAFSVKLSSGKPITFLDTPGHAAFLTMRQRGANVTDIVVLVVAADDSVKPQTLEALKHARAAKVPIIVAINKIDKDGARVDAVKHDLAQAGIEIEDFGGDVQVVCVSGKTGQGMDDLEENILTLSEILDHRAEPDGPAEGWVLESSLKPTGKVATVLVKRGTLRPGDYIAAGVTWAKIRQLRNEAGVDVAEAPPGSPVEILGWRDLPAAGDQVIQSPDEDKAKTAVSYREGLRAREKDAAEYEAINETRKALEEKRAKEKATSTDRGTGVQEVLPDEEDGIKMVNFVVKGDVHGSVEAVCAAIQGLGNHEVRPRVLRSATGPITEFDVDHAATSRSVIVNFATNTPGHVQRMAEEQGVRIIDHTVIYHLVDDVKANLSEYLAPEVSTRVLGEAEILQVFPINLRGRVYKNIAGCRVRNGVVGKNNLYRVVRNGEVVYDGKSFNVSSPLFPYQRLGSICSHFISLFTYMLHFILLLPYLFSELSRLTLFSFLLLR